MIENKFFQNWPEHNIFDRYQGLPDPSHLGLLGSEICYAAETYKAPYEMILLIALIAVSTVTQGLCDVQRPVGGKTSLSLFALLIARSGERKSAVITHFFRLVREAEFLAEKEYLERIHKWKRKIHIWEIHHKELKKKLSEAIQERLTEDLSGHDQTSDEIERAQDLLDTHLEEQPPKPRKLQFLYEDSTYQALLQGIHEKFKNVCVLADEGTRALDGLVTPGLSALNSSYSRLPLNVERRTSESYTLWEQRIAFLLSIQPGPFEEYRERTDKAKKAGLWARTLVCGPHTTIGLRESSAAKPLPENQEYQRRFGKLIDKNLKFAKQPDRPRHLLEFEENAEDFYIRIANEIEFHMRPGGLYEHATDHASKLMENITRIAANLHVINKCDGKISCKTLDIAVHIGVAFSREYMNVFDAPPQHVSDANLLNYWLTERIRMPGIRFISKRALRNFGPSAMRKRGRYQDAIEYLECNGQIKLFQDGTNTCYVDTQPHLLP